MTKDEDPHVHGFSQCRCIWLRMCPLIIGKIICIYKIKGPKSLEIRFYSLRRSKMFWCCRDCLQNRFWNVYMNSLFGAYSCISSRKSPSEFPWSFINVTFRWIWDISLIFGQCIRGVMNTLGYNWTTSGNLIHISHNSIHILFRNQRSFSHSLERMIDGAPVDFY